MEDKNQKIESAIQKTGFLFENLVSNLLSENGWFVINNRYYFDNTLEIERELDLIAYKVDKISEFTIYTALIISCKKNSENSWIFLTKDLNQQDPNIKLYPFDYWSNSRIFQQMNAKDIIHNKLKEEYHTNNTLNYLFVLQRNIFAFQEINIDKSTPKMIKKFTIP
ncbi:hypothetical protein [Leptospira limi]|uniref:Uncharacterized protein n=1 Tax=Leptospira limi TaxID=2950023 RepID=A0ABT3M242_9LEPT|nr:hypothetical protein [Leptospira limi]MCW7464046.1 hypothetical protein [Leptospira limi]